MRGPTEQRRHGSATALFLMLLALAIAGGTTWLLVTPAHRDFVARVSAAVLFAYVWGTGLRVLRNATVAVEPSFDLCLDRPPSVPQFDPLFLRMREELIGSLRSQSYFLHFLWPRLVTLCSRYGRPTTSPPRGSRLPWRGQSLDTITELIAQIECREADQR